MTRTVRAAATAMLVMGGLTAVGCATAERPSVQDKFQSLNGNNCWPERPSYLARESVLHPFEVQANNAAVLDGVINNNDFDTGSDKLNGVGRDKLNRLARKMPAPDSRVYLQTAADVAYDPASPDKVVAARAELDMKRSQAILGYLATRPNTRGVAFDVQAIDVADPGVNAAGPAIAVRGLSTQYSSSLRGMVGGQLQGIGGGQATNTVGVAPGQAAPQGAAQPANPGGGTVTVR